MSTARKKGFTLVETLVALAIVVGAIIGPMVIASQGISFMTYARDQVIAAYLAQDAVEFVIAKKKQSTLNVVYEVPGATNWLNGLEACDELEGCIVDTTVTDLSSYTAPVCPFVDGCSPLTFNTETGVYNYTTGENWINSRYTRTVHIIPLTNPSEAVLTVTITWKHNLITKSFTLKTNIFETVL
ncbi:MAG: prepilin-type N-terminal cleavage/methylation domain-containing protein [Candidatus Pacebacteria bacterium]|nr:prepilin-type N-terminal cleavage/methylation domain-containing protein [Candidatus Paceibacterota bacterium]